MKLCSFIYENANKLCKDMRNCAHGKPSSILWPMSASGIDIVLAIVVYARTSSICAVACRPQSPRSGPFSDSSG